MLCGWTVLALTYLYVLPVVHGIANGLDFDTFARVQLWLIQSNGKREAAAYEIAK